jgi:hypothetical protein
MGWGPGDVIAPLSPTHRRRLRSDTPSPGHPSASDRTVAHCLGARDHNVLGIADLLAAVACTQFVEGLRGDVTELTELHERSKATQLGVFLDSQSYLHNFWVGRPTRPALRHWG